jgi:hypothetical protein
MTNWYEAAEKDYHDVEVGKVSTEELADAIKGLIVGAEQASMFREGVQSLRQFVTECKDVFGLNLSGDPSANVRPLSIVLPPGPM